MGAIHVPEFMSLDGVIDAPPWTFDYGFFNGTTKSVVSSTLKDATWRSSEIMACRPEA